MLAITDYSTKWVKAKPLSLLKKADVIRFICKKHLMKVWHPKVFVSDNETQFMGQKVKDLLRQLKIKFHNSTPSYPQCNEQAVATNKTIMIKIKKRFGKAKGK